MYYLFNACGRGIIPYKLGTTLCMACLLTWGAKAGDRKVTKFGVCVCRGIRSGCFWNHSLWNMSNGVGWRGQSTHPPLCTCIPYKMPCDYDHHRKECCLPRVSTHIWGNHPTCTRPRAALGLVRTISVAICSNYFGWYFSCNEVGKWPSSYRLSLR